MDTCFGRLFRQSKFSQLRTGEDRVYRNGARRAGEASVHRIAVSYEMQTCEVLAGSTVCPQITAFIAAKKMSSPSMLLRKLEALGDPSDEVKGGGSKHRIADSPNLDLPPTWPEQAVIDDGSRIEPSDEALMRGIAARDSRALDKLHTRYRTLLSKIVSPILSNQADAEETIQDVFTEIWTHAARFDGRRGKPLGWIICMTRRRAIDHLRKIRSRAEALRTLLPDEEQDSDAAVAGAAPVPEHVDEVEASDLRRLLGNAIDGLPVEQGRVVRLTYFQAMSQREIARHTGLPHGTVKTRLELAKSKLLNQLGPLRAELTCTR